MPHFPGSKDRLQALNLEVTSTDRIPAWPSSATHFFRPHVEKSTSTTQRRYNPSNSRDPIPTSVSHRLQLPRADNHAILVLPVQLQTCAVPLPPLPTTFPPCEEAALSAHWIAASTSLPAPSW